MAEYDSVIPAGGSGKLMAEIRTMPVRARRLSKSIVVHTDAKEAPNLTLRFTVESRAPILFEPGARFVVYTVEGVAARERVLLRHADGEKLEVYSADTGSEFLEAVIEPVVKKERRDEIEAKPGDVWLDLVLSPDTPVGSLSGRLRLTTNHPMAQSFGIQYVARIQPVVEARPNGVRLWLLGSKDGEGYSTFVNVRHNQPGDFRITEIGVSHPEVFSAATLSTDAAGQQTVRVELVDGLTPETLGRTIEGWVEISTDIQTGVKLDLPVLVAPTRAGTRRPMHEVRRR